MKLTRHNINADHEEFSLQLKQVYKKIHSIVHKINANIDQPGLFHGSLISCNWVSFLLRILVGW